MLDFPFYEIYKALTPELMLVVGAFIALTLDLASLRRYPAEIRNRTIGTVAILALLAAAIPLTHQLGADKPLAFMGRTLVVNNLTAIFNLVILLLTLITVIISLDTDLGRHVGEYYATILFGAIGMMLLVSSEELITIFVALELTSICLYILTAFHKGTLKSQEAAVKYFMFGALSSAFLLFGLSYAYGATGSTNLRIIEQAAQAGNAGHLLAVALMFTVIGFGFKVAVVPFHLWAPDAYEGAPTPVTAFIATGSKVASFFVFLKIMFIGFGGMQGSGTWGSSSGWAFLLAATGAASMILGNLVAITQHNVKRLLAYSSIAHAGYIFIGFVAANVYGRTAVLFYIIVYSLTNIGAFGVVVALAKHAGGETLDNFNGMSRRAPFLSLLMLIFVLSLAGIPPLGGFFGKFYLFAAAIQSDSQSFGLLWLVALGIVMSAVSLYYYLVLLKHIYIIKPSNASRIETPAYLNIVLGVVALAVVGLGVFPEPLLALLKDLVERL